MTNLLTTLSPSDKPICSAQEKENGHDNAAACIGETLDQNKENGNNELKAEVEEKSNNEQENDEGDDCFEENVFCLNREMSKHSFLSANSDSSDQRKKFIENLKPNSSIFTEEETTYKPPRRAKPGKKQGKKCNILINILSNIWRFFGWLP